MLENGLYEQIINNKIDKELSNSDQISQIENIDHEEAPRILSKYLSEIVEKKLDEIKDSSKNPLADQIGLINRILSAAVNENDDELKISNPGSQLFSLYDQKSDPLMSDKNKKAVRPETSIAHSSLFTGASFEPKMFNELKKEILSADKIDMLVSFIRWSGLRLIIDELEAFTKNGGELRIITTSYMGATDIKAIDALSKLSNTGIKVSYDTKITRLHAKAYIFYRNTGFSTAYVGSSNISNAALTSGLEWNTKITKKDLPETLDKVSATFEFYWNDKEFEYYDEGQKDRLYRALKAEKYITDKKSDEIFTADIRPYSYQQEILDKLDAERKIRKQYRNLIVAATGTGKTIISALDYKRFKKDNPNSLCRLLFIAHREEILKQSMYTFRAVLKDANFGDLYVRSYKPESANHLFISIQTFNSQDFTSRTADDFYDFIIIDEFHHAAAPTYQRLLRYYHPKILLGLTATPERMDGKSILSYFNDRIAAEIRLPEAIDRKLLCPFQYFGVTDNIDLDSLNWTRGGYDRTELSNIYTLTDRISDKRADLIINSVMKYVTDIHDVKGLGFCVSVEHARYMSDHFNKHGIPSMHLTGESNDEERHNAKNDLISGKVLFIFVVDIYNEGVDIPQVNTVLFLRPTESLTIFLQQLGRGLRLYENKDCLTVLDFIGQANRKYNFEDKFTALLSNTTKGITREIKKGFISLPKGCYIQLERKAEKYILDNIRSSYNRKSELLSRIDSFEEDTGKPLSMSTFLDHYHMDPRSIYKHDTFSHLCSLAGHTEPFDEKLNDTMTKAFYRFSIIDSRRFISFILKILKHTDDFDLFRLSEMDKKMFFMFYITVWGFIPEEPYNEEMTKNMKALSKCPALTAELIELLQYRFDRIDFIDENADLGFICPLDLHCTYTRDQILTALDFLKPNTVREGVKYLPEKKTDIFFITLNKADKDYSPTTMYKDYSINESLFHWQSQSTTGENSNTGQRYINHRKTDNNILLFVREFKSDNIQGNAMAYTYLGKADYVCHEGEKPMNITWKLEHPIPAKFLKKTNKLVVG